MVNKMKKKLLTILLFASFIVYDATASTSLQIDTVNSYLEYKKSAYLDRYKSSNIVKPSKEPYPQMQELKRGSFEKTGNFQQRVATQEKKLQDQKNRIDKKYLKAVANYNSSIKKQTLKRKKAEDNLPKVLSKSLDSIVNIVFGKPTVKAFEENDELAYNADDEVFLTTIESNALSIQVQIHIPLKQAESLFKAKKLKQLQAVITLEYVDKNLYINKIAIKDNKKTYHVDISDLKNYNPSFNLNYNVSDTLIHWKKKKITDKDILKFEKILAKKRATPALSASDRENQETYDNSCAMCHNSYLSLSDTELWKGMVSKGIDKVYENAINGTSGGMPPKGGTNLSDTRLKSLIDFMLKKAGVTPVKKISKGIPKKTTLDNYRISSRTGNSRIGKKLFDKRLHRSCKVTALEIAQKQSKDEWEKSYKEHHFLSDILTVCPNANTRFLKDKYLVHYLAYFSKLAK